MYIPRELERSIAPFLRRKEAIAILGPRQAGKTTFIHHLEQALRKEKKQVKFLTFEKRSDLELFEDSIEDFKSLIEDYDYVFIDEFQYAHNGGQQLKYLYDTTSVKFIISGSSSLELTFRTAHYMVGRMLDFELLPFSFREYLSLYDEDLSAVVRKRIGSRAPWEFDIQRGLGNQLNVRLSAALETHVLYGGYPAVSLSPTKEKQKVLEGIVEKYFLQDVRGLLRLTTEDELRRLADFLATQIGELISYEELSRASTLSYKQVQSHLAILEKTFIVQLVRPFFRNRRTELVKNPKVYYMDTGVRNFLLSDFRSLKMRNDAGALMENHACNVVSRFIDSGKVRYWRTKSKAEVDFVIEHAGQIYPVEIKYSSKRIIGKSMYSFIEKFQPKTAVILTKDLLTEEKVKKTKIKFIPLSYF